MSAIPKRLFHAGDRVKQLYTYEEEYPHKPVYMYGTVMGDIVWPYTGGSMVQRYYVVWDGKDGADEMHLNEVDRA